MPSHSTEPHPVAYSYIRFSSLKQAEGDSLRRQEAKRAEWCKRNSVNLDTSTTLHDLGRSAFTGKHRENPDRNALAAFLKLVEHGRVPRGAYLIVESLDRLTREHIRPALTLLLNLIDGGVRIVQLEPVEVIYDEHVEPMQLMMALMELSRGHSESKIKGERVGKAWANKKRKAREEGETLTVNLPGWIEIRGGKRCIKPGAKATVKRVFQLASQGYGRTRIMRLFAAEGVPAFGTSGRWTRPYLHCLLNDRRLLGEFQPTLLTTGKPDGPVIPDYFPRVLSDAEFYVVQRDRQKRKTVRRDATPVELQSIEELHQQGNTVAEISRKLGTSRQAIYRALVRLGRREKPAEQSPRPVYLFGGGMVSDYGSERRFNLATWRKGDGYGKALVLDGGSTSFPYAIFERALLHELRELDPREVLEGANGHDNVVALEGELGTIEARIAELEDELLSGDVKAVSRVLRQLETRQAELSRRLADARQKAANPLSAAWGEVKTLLAALDAATDQDDARVRLRAALRRIIASIKMAVLSGTGEKIALVDVEFAGEHDGRFRTLTIWYRRSYGNGSFRHPGSWGVVSAAGQGRPIEFSPSDEPAEPPIPTAADWALGLPVEPTEWFPLPE